MIPRMRISGRSWIPAALVVTALATTAFAVTEAAAPALAATSVAATTAPSPVVQNDELGAFAWLEGEWQRTMRRGVAIERWRHVPGVGLVGEAVLRPTDADTEVPTEALLLVTMGADTFYIARPSENPYPVAFRLVSHADDTAVFENPTHDFPQRIIYRRISDDAMTVSIEGPGDDGRVRTIDFEFRRR